MRQKIEIENRVLYFNPNFQFLISNLLFVFFYYIAFCTTFFCSVMTHVAIHSSPDVKRCCDEKKKNNDILKSHFCLVFKV